MSAKQMTAITQVHYYIKEHFVPSDIISLKDLQLGLKHLTYSSISASLWKLGKENILLVMDETGPSKLKLYMVNDNYMNLRGTENREAAEPGLKRKHKRKQKEKQYGYANY